MASRLCIFWGTALNSGRLHHIHSRRNTRSNSGKWKEKRQKRERERETSRNIEKIQSLWSTVCFCCTIPIGWTIESIIHKSWSKFSLIGCLPVVFTISFISSNKRLLLAFFVRSTNSRRTHSSFWDIPSRERETVTEWDEMKIKVSLPLARADDDSFFMICTQCFFPAAFTAKMFWIWREIGAAGRRARKMRNR